MDNRPECFDLDCDPGKLARRETGRLPRPVATTTLALLPAEPRRFLSDAFARTGITSIHGWLAGCAPARLQAKRSPRSKRPPLRFLPVLSGIEPSRRISGLRGHRGRAPVPLAGNIPGTIRDAQSIPSR